MKIKQLWQTIVAAKTLTNTDPSIQILENTTAGNLNVDLVSISETDKYFAIINTNTYCF